MAQLRSMRKITRPLGGDGSCVWMESTGRDLRNDRTGEVEPVLTVIRDVAARKEAEAALDESETRFRINVDSRASRGTVQPRPDGIGRF